MVRIIKRYGSRKLYDTEESRYVSLDEIAASIRGGQDVRVVDNRTSQDVTGATLAQVLSEEGRRGGSSLTSDLLHQIIRLGEKAMASGMEHLVRASMERLKPVRRAREEMAVLRARLEQLEASLAEVEAGRAGRSRPRSRPAAPRASPRRKHGEKR